MSFPGQCHIPDLLLTTFPELNKVPGVSIWTDIHNVFLPILACQMFLVDSRFWVHGNPCFPETPSWVHLSFLWILLANNVLGDLSQGYWAFKTTGNLNDWGFGFLFFPFPTSKLGSQRFSTDPCMLSSLMVLSEMGRTSVPHPAVFRIGGLKLSGIKLRVLLL